MIDNIPPEVGLPLAGILWLTVAIYAIRSHIKSKKANR